MSTWLKFVKWIYTYTHMHICVLIQYIFTLKCFVIVLCFIGFSCENDLARGFTYFSLEHFAFSHPLFGMLNMFWKQHLGFKSLQKHFLCLLSSSTLAFVLGTRFLIFISLLYEQFVQIICLSVRIVLWSLWGKNIILFVWTIQYQTQFNWI